MQRIDVYPRDTEQRSRKRLWVICGHNINPYIKTVLFTCILNYSVVLLISCLFSFKSTHLLKYLWKIENRLVYLHAFTILTSYNFWVEQAKLFNFLIARI